MIKGHLRSVLSRAILFVGSVLVLFLVASALHAQAPDPTNPDWQRQLTGSIGPPIGNYRLDISKTGNVVKYHAYQSAAPGADPILDGERTLELRKTGVAPRAITRFYSLYESKSWSETMLAGPMAVNVTVAPQPQTIPMHEHVDVYGQLVVIWVMPTTQENIRWGFIQLVNDHTVGIPGVPPVPNWVPQFAGWRADAPYQLQSQGNPFYPGSATAHPDNISKGFFMYDVPGIVRPQQVLPTGFLRARAYFRTWAYGGLQTSPPTVPLERFLTGEFRWGFWRQFWSDGHEPHHDILGVKLVTWQQYSKTLPAYKIWYSKVMGHPWWPLDMQGPGAKSVYLPRPE